MKSNLSAPFPIVTPSDPDYRERMAACKRRLLARLAYNPHSIAIGRFSPDSLPSGWRWGKRPH